MAWFYLTIAGLAEVVWAAALKESHGFTRLMPSIITAIFMVVSFVGLSMAMKSLPLGTAYTVWVGIGAVGAFITGIVMFGETFTAMRVIAAGLIISGVIILKLATK